ncbi:hypothetical protein [Puia dinghuensis]|uniref:hypothetical protein n=1 Tax=Puia dinghuensis TaxID=1792502 RepID=UPI0016683524|nr:hypothetical protein [Puia dinghuensis]
MCQQLGWGRPRGWDAYEWGGVWSGARRLVRLTGEGCRPRVLECGDGGKMQWMRAGCG